MRSDFAEQVWVWDNGEGGLFYFDIGETVRFRVEAEEWHDQIPNAPDMPDGSAMAERKPPYSIIVRSLNFRFTFCFDADNCCRARCRLRVLDLLPGGREDGQVGPIFIEVTQA